MQRLLILTAEARSQLLVEADHGLQEAAVQGVASVGQFDLDSASGAAIDVCASVSTGCAPGRAGHLRTGRAPL